MKEIKVERITVAGANDLLGVDMEPGFWEAVIGLIGYPELTFEPASQTICFPGYVPFQALAKEWIDGIEAGLYDIRLCERCAAYFDLNHTDGIFANPTDLSGFICMPCAEAMSAREYFEKHLRT
jgi:hypothetical protein